MRIAEKNNRIIYSDLLRITAIFFMIIIHVMGVGWINFDYNTFNWSVVNVYNSISRFCVPVFIMISGSFMLDSKRTYTIKKLYSHNILRIITAFVFWSAAYAFLVNITKYKSLNPSVLSVMAVSFFKGHYHLWFLFTIACLYMIVPFLRKICENKRTEEYFLILCLFFTFVYNFVMLFISSQTVLDVINNVTKKANMFFVLGYVGYFVLGHYLTAYEMPKKLRTAVYILGAVSIVFSAVLARHLVYSGADRESTSVYDYLQPTTLLTAAAVFFAFKYGISKLNFGSRSSKIIVGVSKLSFGVYLVHDFVIILFYSIGFKITSFNILISVPIMSLAVFLISLGITFIISKIPILKKYII